jgi:hypothetical protein
MVYLESATNAALTVTCFHREIDSRHYASILEIGDKQLGLHLQGFQHRLAMNLVSGCHRACLWRRRRTTRYVGPINPVHCVRYEVFRQSLLRHPETTELCKTTLDPSPPERDDIDFQKERSNAATCIISGSGRDSRDSDC